MKKGLMTAGIITAVSVVGITGASIASAATNAETKANPVSSLVDAVASKFNLNRADVQSVFDEQHTKMQAAREQAIQDKVAQLVTDGTLTQAQADAINAKRAELQKEREADRTGDQTKTDAERKTEMESRKTTLNTWLKENGLSADYSYLLMGGRGHGPGGHDGPFGYGTGSTQSDSGTNSSTQN